MSFVSSLDACYVLQIFNTLKGMLSDMHAHLFACFTSILASHIMLWMDSTKCNIV